jgi:integrase
LGTISERKPKGGKGPSTWCAQIRKKKGGKVVLSISQTFARRSAAEIWIDKKEKELDRPGALERAIADGGMSTRRPTLGDAIDRVISDSVLDLKKTKLQVLRSTKGDEIAQKACEDIGSEHIVDFAKRLLDGNRDPSTVGNYLSHLSSVFSVARPAWKLPLDAQAMADAAAVCKRLGYSSKSKERDRRPKLDELDRLMAHFLERSRRRRASPMHKITAFAIFSTRRQAEISGLLWDDLDDATAEHAAGILVRKMKNPGDSQGVDRWCELPPEAMAIIHSMPKKEPRIFPYGADGISKAFTDACALLAIENLHFHDLRHEGVSWLIERGRTKEQAAMVSGHKSWTSLQRYAQPRKQFNKYEGWRWLPIVTEPPATSLPFAVRRAIV